jgi:hypothetical protein
MVSPYNNGPRWAFSVTAVGLTGCNSATIVRNLQHKAAGPHDRDQLERLPAVADRGADTAATHSTTQTLAQSPCYFVKCLSSSV